MLSSFVSCSISSGVFMGRIPSQNAVFKAGHDPVHVGEELGPPIRIDISAIPKFRVPAS